MKIDRHNYEEWLLRKVENDLNQSEAEALEKFLTQHPEYREELAAFEKTVLIPEAMVFQNKASLYRGVAESKVIPMWQRKPMYWAAAASIALVVGLSVWLFNNNPNQPDNNVATENNQPSVNQPVIPKDSSPVLPENIAKPESHLRKESPKGVLRTFGQGVENYVSSDKKSNSGNKSTNMKQAKEDFEMNLQHEENNFAAAVTNRDDVALQPLETYPMIQFQLSQSQPVAEPLLFSYADVKRNESNAVRLITDALKLSGKDDLAKAFQRYSRLADKKLEVTLNHERLNLHKTLYLNNN